MNRNDYIPALRYSWLTRFYDPVVALTTRETVFRQKLLDQADISSGDRVIDLACGTGTFAILLKTRFPDVTVTGLDGDPSILAKAILKAGDAGVDVAFNEGMSYALPYEAGKFDIVFSSLFFHHLQTEEKLRTMKEVLRVLKPGGVFHICDWGPPSSVTSKVMFNAIRVLDGYPVTQDNFEGRLPVFLRTVGFGDARVCGQVETNLGTLDLMYAIKNQ